MKITKRFDRAFQWAGEKMGSSEARTAHSDEFKALEAEMSLRIDGMERLHKSMNAYVKWTSRREELAGDRERAVPGGHVGRVMVGHGEEFEADSEFGNSLIAVGRANERVASLQEQFAGEATSTWLEALNRNLAMMRDYQNARKKLESRRLAYDSAATKANRSKREDHRLEDDVRTAKAKFEEASDDVLRRMQDIKEAETDSLRELTAFLDAELDFHDRCADELRRARADLGGVAPVGNAFGSSPPRPRSRKPSYVEKPAYVERPRDMYEEYEPEPERPRSRKPSYVERPRDNIHEEYEPERPRLVSRPSTRRPPPEVPAARPAPSRSSTASSFAPSFTSSQSYSHSPPERRPKPQRSSTTLSAAPQQQMAINPSNLRSQLRPVGRFNTEPAPQQQDDVFADYEDGTSESGGGSPRWERDGSWGQRSVSPATSVSEWSRGSGGSGGGLCKKAPPPPPPSRAKKPAPPVPRKREVFA